MKQVTIAGVKDFINEIEKGGLSLREEYVLACLRELVAVTEKVRAVTEQRDALVVKEQKPVAYIIQDAEMRSNGNPGFLSYDGSISDEDKNEYEISVTPLYTHPVTEAAIAALRAEAKAEAIPDGYVLVPQEMHLPAESMEGICFHCGDGGHQFGEFTDGTLFVGEVDYGDGKKVYGLHIATAEYPEEGCATICEFARQLRESKGEVQS